MKLRFFILSKRHHQHKTILYFLKRKCFSFFYPTSAEASLFFGRIFPKRKLPEEAIIMQVENVHLLPLSLPLFTDIQTFPFQVSIAALLVFTLLSLSKYYVNMYQTSWQNTNTFTSLRSLQNTRKRRKEEKKKTLFTKLSCFKVKPVLRSVLQDILSDWLTSFFTFSSSILCFLFVFTI